MESRWDRVVSEGTMSVKLPDKIERYVAVYVDGKLFSFMGTDVDAITALPPDLDAIPANQGGKDAE